MKLNVDEVYEKFKTGRPSSYDEEKHCKLILKILATGGRYSTFCMQELICEKTFYTWISRYELFAQCYSLGRMISRELWEQQGEQIAEETLPMGSINNKYDHWKMRGWTYFGIGKISRIKLKIDPSENPAKHYEQLIRQAAEGDFTAAEIKQLMEAINVGLNTHQVFCMQKEIDDLKKDLEIMVKNSNANNTLADKRTAKKD
jgi:hypothetical protein